MMTRRMNPWVLPVFLMLCLASGTASAIAPVRPPVIVPATYVFTFTGACSDCYDGAGNARAELTLDNYTFGDDITTDNFVSFHYDGTDLLQAFTINDVDVNDIGGSIDGPLPSAESFFVGTDSMVFSSGSSGFWCVGGSCDADTGPTSSYALAAAVDPGTVPEPMPVALLAGGVLAALVARRKRD